MALSAVDTPPEKRQRVGEPDDAPPQLSAEQLARIERNRAAAMERRRLSGQSGKSAQPEKLESPAATTSVPAKSQTAVESVPTPLSSGSAQGGVVLTDEQRAQIQQRRLAAMERRRALQAETQREDVRCDQAASPATLAAPEQPVQAEHEHVASSAAPDGADEAATSTKDAGAPVDMPAPGSPAPSAPPSPASSSSSRASLAGSAAPSSPVPSEPSLPGSAHPSDDEALDDEAADRSDSSSSSGSTSSNSEDGDASELGDNDDSAEECGSQASLDGEEERQCVDERDDGLALPELLPEPEEVTCAAPISPRDAVCACAVCTGPSKVAIPPPKPVETRSAKQALVAQLLCRWWYVLPEWPPADYSFESALAKHRLRRVPLRRFDMEPEIDERGFTKVYELGQFKGLFRAVGDRLYDLRPVEGRPSYDQLMQKSSPELHRLLVAAYKEQLAELERQPPKGKDREDLKQTLRQKLKEVQQKASFSLMFAPKPAENAKE